MLVGNKTDLKDQRDVSEEEGREFAKKSSLLFIETSAKDNVRVSEAFEKLIHGMTFALTNNLKKPRDLPSTRE
jgi:GTPase SAR1 family protein